MFTWKMPKLDILWLNMSAKSIDIRCSLLFAISKLDTDSVEEDSNNNVILYNMSKEEGVRLAAAWAEAMLDKRKNHWK